MNDIRALSIQQPWAWAIMNAGKDIENRDWNTSYRGPFLIHASKKIDEDSIDTLDDLTSIILPNKYLIGGIIGVVDLMDVVTDSSSPWFYGRFGFVLRNPRKLPFIPCRGQLGFWRPPEDVMGKIMELGVVT